MIKNLLQKRLTFIIRVSIFDALSDDESNSMLVCVIFLDVSSFSLEISYINNL
mgnify:CR=1 FL=1